MDASRWPDYKAELTAIFKQKSRDEWCAIMEGTDVCFAPVLSIFEAPSHPHNQARNTFVQVEGVTQPAPAPRFSRTEPAITGSARAPGADTAAVLADCGFTADEVAELQAVGVIAAG